MCGEIIKLTLLGSLIFRISDLTDFTLHPNTDRNFRLMGSYILGPSFRVVFSTFIENSASHGFFCLLFQIKSVPLAVTLPVFTAKPWTYCNNWVWVDCSRLGKKAAESAVFPQSSNSFLTCWFLFINIQSREMNLEGNFAVCVCFGKEDVPTSSCTIKWLLFNSLPHMHTHSWMAYLVYP